MKLLHKSPEPKGEISDKSKKVFKPDKTVKKSKTEPKPKAVGSLLRIGKKVAKKLPKNKNVAIPKIDNLEVIKHKKNFVSKKVTAEEVKASAESEATSKQAILSDKKSIKIVQNVSPKVSELQPLKSNCENVPSDKVTVMPPLNPQKIKDKNKLRNKVKYVLPSTFVTDEIVSNALDALFKLSEAKRSATKMFEEEAPVFFQINTIKIQNKAGNINFQLAHCTAPSTGEICLITPDLKKGRKPDHEPTIEHWEKLLREANVTKVKTVLPMRQLRVEYDQFELKRRLMTQHDFIMVDTRVINHVSHILGKMFFKKHNMLIPVRMQSKDLKKSIDKALNSAVLKLNQGPTSSLLVGNLGMKKKKLEENILMVIKQLKEKFPGGERNIRSLEVKMPNSLAIPIYWTLRPKKTITVPRMPERVPKNSMDVEGELTTLMNAKVRVTSSGRVKVEKIPEEDTLLESDDAEENEDENPEEPIEEVGEE